MYKENMIEKKYYFKDGLFIIEDYDKVKPFASFLPAIAGKKGIPMWCYYVNRGQGVASFGLRDKDGGILEFSPANTSYRVVDKLGFRTFVKANGKYQELFDPRNLISKRKMYIDNSKFSIEEINKELGIKILVTYFGLPNENIGALVRKVEIENIDNTKEIELLDGLTQIIPSGVGEWSMKHQSNLIKSWMDVLEIKDNIAFYKTNSAPGDEAEVKEIQSGNYYLSFLDGKTIKPIYDANVVFGTDTTFSLPLNFIQNEIEELTKIKQVAADKVPVGFTPLRLNLEQKKTIYTLIGFSYNKEMIESKVERITRKGYIENKEVEAKAILEDLLVDVYTKTNYPIFDSYMKQNYLDNILRGGYPLLIETDNRPFIYHLYSRRHGDLEREYNFFTIAPEFYSQGNGNFRDVCQNRRSDNLFHKEVEIYNAKVFANLIQLDGYNPLGVEGSVFHLKDKNDASELAKLFSNEQEIIKNILSNKFTPGIIMNAMEAYNIKTKYSDEELLKIIFNKAEQEINANFGEGYWSDHWTYIYDLIENALVIYPEKINEYLFNDNTYMYYNSPVTVLPRSEKYCLTNKNVVRQYGALKEPDTEKIQKLNMNVKSSNWTKDKDGKVVYTNLFGKLLTLCTLKFASLDSIGVGIEMEGNKPGWNDAMNGLPGLFGSGVSETIELARIVKFLDGVASDSFTDIPLELFELISNICKVYNEEEDSFIIWDKVTSFKEQYRNKTRFGISNTIKIKANEFKSYISLMKKVLDRAIEKALEIGKGIFPTFIVFEATDYELNNHIGNYNLPTVTVKKFSYRMLPYFLEAPARALKYITSEEEKKLMHKLVKESQLYDKVYKMYKTSVSLENEGYEIGRVRAFQSGWLERESNFLHMTYKYLLGLLKGQMYDEFYEEVKDNFVCFMNPSVYGRSTLENSSFIAPSNNPDDYVKGQGFVSRLSGSTAEMLSIWQIMMFGYQPYTFNNGILKLSLKPILSSDFFTKENEVEALFQSSTIVKYVNNEKKNIYNQEPKTYQLISDYEILFEKTIDGDLAKRVRNGEFKIIICQF